MISTKRNLLYRNWKFKQAVPSVGGGLSMFTMPYPEIFDLTIVGTLLHSTREAPAKFEIGYYELINDSLVMLVPGNEGAKVEFKILELTQNTLKLMLHLEMDNGSGRVDTDVVMFVFEVQ
jgi:hypothetical protein